MRTDSEPARFGDVIEWDTTAGPPSRWMFVCERTDYYPGKKWGVWLGEHDLGGNKVGKTDWYAVDHRDDAHIRLIRRAP